MTAKKTTAKTTWTPAWSVRFDGSQLDPVEVSDTGKATVQVRKPGASGTGQRWERARYQEAFASSPEAAIEKFQRQTQQAVIDATRELQEAQALFARALTLTPAAVATPTEEA